MKLTLQLVVVVLNAATKFRDSLFKFTLFLPHTNTVILPPGVVGIPHMKVVGMLVFSLRGVSFGFWSHLFIFFFFIFFFFYLLYLTQ